MVFVNFKIVMGAEQNGPVWLIRLAGMFDGRAAATFVVLAGIGVSLVSRRGRTSGNRRQVAMERNALLRRALFLFAGGMVYATIYQADILHFYGIYLGFAAFMLVASNPSNLGVQCSACARLCGNVIHTGLRERVGLEYT